MTNQTQNAVSTPATEIQVGTIFFNADAVGNGRVVVKVYGNHECAPAKLDDIAAKMPRLSDINIIAHDHRNFIAKGASYNGRYYAKANVYIFTNTSYGTADAKKMYKFDTAKEAVRKLARQELDDKIITAEELEILLAADREIERQREAKREAERAERDAELAKYEHDRYYAAKIALDSKSVNDNFRYCIYCAPQQSVQTALAESREDDNTDVFDLLPTADELNDVDTDDEARTEFARKVADKLFRVERFSQEQVDAVVAAILDDNHDAAAVKKLINDFKAENFNEAQKVAARLEEIIAAEVKADPLNALDTADYAVTEDAFIFATNCEIIARQRAELRAAIDNVPLPGKDVELWRERNEVAVEINKLYKIEKLLTVDEFNAKLRILQEKLKDIDEQITACQNADTERKVAAAELKAKYDASDDEDERVEICIEAYRNYIEPRIKQQTRKIAEQICDSMTAAAPDDWSVAFTENGKFAVYSSDSVNVVDTITAGDFLNPKEFFEQFRRKPTQAELDDEREAALAELNHEREQLLTVRDELAREYPDEVERLKLLDEMIAETDADIDALETFKKPRDAVEFDDKGNVKAVWF